MKMTLRAAVNAASVICLDGIPASRVEYDGLIELEAISNEGLEYTATLLEAIEIEIDDAGCATVPDVDGEDTRLTFYVPMRG